MTLSPSVLAEIERRTFAAMRADADRLARSHAAPDPDDLAERIARRQRVRRDAAYLERKLAARQRQSLNPTTSQED